MPARPPLFRPAGWAERKPWAPRSAVPATKRIRGRAGQKLRAQVLIEEPLCRLCLRAGREVRAEVVDHIVPLAAGGAEARANRQALCHPCHDAKSAAERANGGANGAAFPEWLKPATGALTIVCGPPFAGQDELLREEAGQGDLVIEMDAIKRVLWPGYRAWSSPFELRLHARALRYRNHLLSTMARPEARDAWLIVPAPSEGEREWWQGKLGGELVLLDPGQAECERRAVQGLKRGALPAIADWYRRSQLSWERE